MTSVQKQINLNIDSLKNVCMSLKMQGGVLPNSVKTRAGSYMNILLNLTLRSTSEAVKGGLCWDDLVKQGHTYCCYVGVTWHRPLRCRRTHRSHQSWGRSCCHAQPHLSGWAWGAALVHAPGYWTSSTSSVSEWSSFHVCGGAEIQEE